MTKHAKARHLTPKMGYGYQPSEEGTQLYKRVVEVLLKVDHQKASDVYLEYQKKFCRCLDANLAFRVAQILYNREQYFSAATSMELILDVDNLESELHEKVLYRLSLIMEKVENEEAAAMYREKFLSNFPNSPLSGNVRKSLRIA